MTASSSISTTRSTSSKSQTLLAVGRPGDILFDYVWFRYGGEWTLQDVSFSVPAGTKTALVGETGSGKTTLAYLAARLYEPDRGRIAIDGVDIRDLSFEALSDLVGVVSQETYLFHASVRENLSFAKTGREQRGDRGRRQGRPHPRTDLLATGRIRLDRRRARLSLLRW